MSVRFLLGASGSGKSRQIYNEIIQTSIKEPERNFYLIVPEQYTMEAQRELVTMHPAGGMMNIDAIGMNRLAYRVFDEFEASDIKEMENGDLIITTEMPEDNWLIGYLLSFGTQVTVIEPIYLKKILADEAKKIYEKNKP